MGKYKDILKDLSAGSAGVRAKIPGVYEAFGNVYRSAYSDGALSAKHKELIAVGIAVHEGCDGCIASHVRSAVRDLNHKYPSIANPFQTSLDPNASQQILE